MKNTRAKIIIGTLAILTAGSLFAIKGKMMHHRKMHYKGHGMEKSENMRDGHHHKNSTDHRENTIEYKVEDTVD